MKTTTFNVGESVLVIKRIHGRITNDQGAVIAKISKRPQVITLDDGRVFDYDGDLHSDQGRSYSSSSVTIHHKTAEVLESVAQHKAHEANRRARQDLARRLTREIEHIQGWTQEQVDAVAALFPESVGEIIEARGWKGES